MRGFAVDAGELEASASAISRAADAAAPGVLEDPSGVADAGVRQACSRMASRWSQALGQLRGDTGEAGQRLAKAARLYREGDEAGKRASNTVLGRLESR